MSAHTPGPWTVEDDKVLWNALAGFIDLSNGWPERELHKTPAEIIEQARAAIAKADPEHLP